MDAIAAKLGLTPTYQNSSFDTIFRDVASGQFDIVAAAATITPARSKVVDFSRPYYEAQQALVVPEGSDITSTDDLAGEDRRRPAGHHRSDPTPRTRPTRARFAASARAPTRSPP